MVQRRRRKIEWTVNAIQTKKSIFYYWNNRNKSTVYSQKLNQLFTATLKRVENNPKASIATKTENVRAILVRDYYLIFEITELNIKVLDIWDTRQNPQDFPIK
jgi:ParE toxin of type II toxin-antitoxin system, parDE